MTVHTFRAKSIQQALARVRLELGPDASVLHTRRLNTGLVSRLVRGVEVEVAATAGAPAGPRPDRVPDRAPEGFDHRDRFREAAASEAAGVLLTGGAAAAHDAAGGRHAHAPHTTVLFDAFTRLIEADIDEPICRRLLLDLRQSAPDAAFACPQYVAKRLATLVAERLRSGGPIRSEPHASSAGRRPHVAALVGPTGVGKTTTIAKLAANFRLREERRVGLVTVDTYRVAAVEQLRTYAELIDLPMEVVATPREMRAAISRLADVDLILMDTAGRGPRDAAKLQELKSILAESCADEVHLVLSATAGSRCLARTAERFAPAGVTSLLLTKLDEAPSLGPLLTLADAIGAPISYLTNGQNVPEDIAVADGKALAERVLGSAE